MAALPAGVQYGLSSEATNHDNKDLVLVKLTDSALRSIEEFIRNMGKIGSTPTIQFLPGDVGKISIPSGAGGSQPVTFRFSLANNAEMEGPQGSLECLQAAGARQLRNVGALPTRMRILANDDVYEATKQRMTVDAENLKSKCTRVIKPNQTDIGRKVKVKQQRPPPPRAPSSATLSHPSPIVPVPTPAPTHSNPYHSSNHNVNQASNHNHSSINNNSTNLNGSTALSGGTALSGNGVHNGSAYLNGGANHNGSVNHNSSANHSGIGNHIGNGNHNSNGNPAGSYQSGQAGFNGSGSHNSGAGGGYTNLGSISHPPGGGSAGQPRPSKPAGNPDLLRRPIKERLIQLLALRPYKKPELYSRINSEGIKDKERSVIKTILQQISCLKDNCYQLHRHLWNDVNEDWPFYSDEEKQILKRRKPQNLTPPLSSDSGHSPSPPPALSAGHKRPAPAAAPAPVPSPGPAAGMAPGPAAAPPIKKQRISHYRKPGPPGPNDSNTREGSGSPAALSNGYHSSTSMSSGERKSYSDEDTPPPTTQTPTKRDNGYSLSFGTAGSAKNFLGTPPKQNCYETSPMAEHVSPLPATKGGISPVCSSVRDKSPDSTTVGGANTPQQDLPDYTSEYTEITCPEQRRRYKLEFAAQYEQYRVLHTRVDAVTRVFTRLEERLRGEHPGGCTHREIKRQIVKEYQRTQGDVKYQQDMALFKYLHLKLAHIKQLVLDYDRLGLH